MVGRRRLQAGRLPARRTMKMIRTATLLVALLVPSAAMAQGGTTPQGTPQERAACRPDVRRLCHNINASEGETYLGCLKLNREKLSRACRAVLEKHGQ